jgi:hypothetical protein
LVLWDGLPISQSSWEPASSLDFDVEEIVDGLPDLTGCKPSDIDGVLSATAAASLRQTLKVLKQPADTPASFPSHSKRTNSAVFNFFADASRQFAVTAEDNWWDFLPTLNVIDAAEVELAEAAALFDSRIPDSPDRTNFDKELCCLISPEWLSDTPINNLGACIAVPNTVCPPEFQKIQYVLSFYSSGILAIGDDEEAVRMLKWTNLEDTASAAFLLTAYNDGGNHWFAAVYSHRLSTWLILDSIRRSYNYYSVPVYNCTDAIVQCLAVTVDSQSLHFVVCPDWPQQGNGYDCGVYACIAFMLRR